MTGPVPSRRLIYPIEFDLGMPRETRRGTFPSKDRSENGRLNTDLILTVYRHASHVMTYQPHSSHYRMLLWQTVNHLRRGFAGSSLLIEIESEGEIGNRDDISDFLWRSLRMLNFTRHRPCLPVRTPRAGKVESRGVGR